MKRIHYSDVKSIKKKYEQSMAHALNDAGWLRVRTKLMRLVPEFSDSKLPLHHKDILTADFPKLAEIYVIYVKSNIQNTQPKLHKDLKKLFNYDFDNVPNPKNADIKRFFCENSHAFGISTCHYCDMAYINVYGGEDKVKDALNFLNTADFDRLKEVLRYADSTINKICDQRKSRIFSSASDYNGRINDRRISYDNVVRKIQSSNSYDSHFDLDHFLDKARCPIVALSVFNFVPSCTICNQRLKHSAVLGELDVAKLCHYSPTCNNYTFETDVKLKVFTDTGLPFLDYVNNKDRCNIEFICTGKKHYEREIEFFRLKERYQYHKIEALRLMDLRQRYKRKGKIDEIARLIYGENNDLNRKLVEDDIFQTYFKSELSRTFSKLYKDIISD